MENDDLISPNMPEVIKVRYLADSSYDEYTTGIVVLGESEEDKLAVGEADNEQGGSGMTLLDGVLGAFGALVIILLALLLIKRRRNKVSDQEDDTTKQFQRESQLAHVGSDMSLEDDLDSIINNIDAEVDDGSNFGDGSDPPGSFHLGNHHYTRSGVRYFSPCCALCIAAAAANADGAIAHEVNNEEDEEIVDNLLGMDLTCVNKMSFDLEAAKNFEDFNSNDLGKYHSSMHVRHCKSTTCEICLEEKGVYFVKARKEQGEVEKEREVTL
jgi:hypothetical protein